MQRKIVIAALLGLAMLVSTAATTFAQAGLSPRNPYRSFNSGVNYGAQQWERSHHRYCGHGRLVRQR